MHSHILYIYMHSTPSKNIPQCCLCSTSNFDLTGDGLISPFQGRLSTAAFFYTALLQEIDGVISLVLCLWVVSQAPQHFRPPETQATWDCCFARQSDSCLKLLNTSDLPKRKPLGLLLCPPVRSVVALPPPIYLLSHLFPLSPACPGQKTHTQHTGIHLPYDVRRSVEPLPGQPRTS